MTTIAERQILAQQLKLLENGIGAPEGGELPVIAGFRMSGWSWVRSKMGKIGGLRN